MTHFKEANPSKDYIAQITKQQKRRREQQCITSRSPLSGLHCLRLLNTMSHECIEQRRQNILPLSREFITISIAKNLSGGPIFGWTRYDRPTVPELQINETVLVILF